MNASVMMDTAVMVLFAMIKMNVILVTIIVTLILNVLIVLVTLNVNVFLDLQVMTSLLENVMTLTNAQLEFIFVVLVRSVLIYKAVLNVIVKLDIHVMTMTSVMISTNALFLKLGLIPAVPMQIVIITTVRIRANVALALLVMLLGR